MEVANKLSTLPSIGNRYPISPPSGKISVTPCPAKYISTLSFSIADEAMLDKFRKHVINREVVINEDAWQGDLEFIRAMIRFQIDVDLFSNSHARRRLFEVDPQINYALGLFSEARQLADLASETNIKRQ